MDTFPTQPSQESELPSDLSLAQKRDEVLRQILASDFAVEISAEFAGRRSTGWDVPGATSQVIGRFHEALSRPAEGPVLILSLAALQYRDDHLQAVIRDAAVDLIDSGEAMAAYRSDDFSQRKLVAKLLSDYRDLLAEARVVEL